MIKRSIHNYEKDLRLINNEDFIDSCFNYISMRLDDLKRYDYNESNQDRKIADCLFYMQLNGKYINIFNKQSFLEAHENHLDWKLISCDNRIKWSIDLIDRFKEKLNFGTIHDEYLNHLDLNFIQKANHITPSVCGLSLSPNLTIITIDYFKEIWDWEILPNNPLILEFAFNNPFYFSKCIKEVSFSSNSGWTIDYLVKIKEIYKNLTINNRVDIDGFWGISSYEGIEINWCFSWPRVFKNALIIWNDTNIELFLDVLNNYDNKYSKRKDFSNECWQKISSNIIDKSLIIRFKEKLNFYNLASNDKIIWDKDLTGILLESTFELEGDNMDGYYGTRVKKLPYYLEKIKITEEAILFYKNFWTKKYLYGHYHRNSDGTEERFIESTFIYNLKKNNNIIWSKPINKEEFFDSIKEDC